MTLRECQETTTKKQFVLCKYLTIVFAWSPAEENIFYCVDFPDIQININATEGLQYMQCEWV